jgi:hypothetical protein
MSFPNANTIAIPFILFAFIRVHSRLILPGFPHHVTFH